MAARTACQANLAVELAVRHTAKQPDGMLALSRPGHRADSTVQRVRGKSHITPMSPPAQSSPTPTSPWPLPTPNSPPSASTFKQTTP